MQSVLCKDCKKMELKLDKFLDDHSTMYFKIKGQHVQGSIPGSSQKVVCSMYFASESYIFWPYQLVMKNTGLIPGSEKDALARKPLVQAPPKPECTSVWCFWRQPAAAWAVPRDVREVSVEPGLRDTDGICTHVHWEMELLSQHMLPWHELFLLLARLQGVRVLCNSAGFRCI